MLPQPGPGPSDPGHSDPGHSDPGHSAPGPSDPIPSGTTPTGVTPSARTSAGPIRDVLSGVGYLGRGFGLWITSPRLMLLGAIPALVVGLVYLVGIVVLIVNLDTIVVWATPFASGWAEPLVLSTRVAAALILMIVAALFAVYTFTAVTLVVGDPFYERIWRQVETTLGGAPPEIEQSLLHAIGRGIGDGLRLLIPAIGVGILLLACGFIPLVGPVAVAVFGALFGGWLLVVELTGFAFDARGYSLRDRRRALRSRRAVAIGFGAASYLLFLVPFLAVVAMPSAVAGAAMLSRDTIDGRAVPPSA